ncbi:hypothetical protein RB596_009093 [Gaeumannomyces avenae]
MSPPIDRGGFRLAIICALRIESDAVRLLFDEIYEKKYGRETGDTNTYTTGRIGNHAAVLLLLPGMGMEASAAGARSLQSSYTNIKLALIVGVCGGLPQIRGRDAFLGDVIVSKSIVNHDFGRQYPDKFVVRSTEDTLGQTNNDIRGLLELLEGKDELDRLQKKARANLNRQQERPVELVPQVFMGRVACGNAVMKSGKHRDAVAKEHNVIAFEMEGAGAWNEVPCIVVKGICDYADSHKNKKWQNFAAATAASVAAAILDRYEVPGGAMEGISKKRRLNSDGPMEGVSKKQRLNLDGRNSSNTNSHNVTTIDNSNRNNTTTYNSNSTTTNSHNATTNSHSVKNRGGVVAMIRDVGGNLSIVQQNHVYSKYTQEPPQPLLDCLKSLAFPQMHNRSHDIHLAATGTCEWLLRHKTYLSWAACDQGLLWIKGKPGSGKSTLLKYALDSRERMPGPRDLILSFFFHGRGDELQRTSLGLYRSLLHQVLSQVPDALPDFVDTFEKNCKEMGKPGDEWQWHLQELQRFFELSLPKVLKTRQVWLFVDALDECSKENAVDLAEWFESLLRNPFRICFACRHYPILALDCAFEICLENENRNDISVYVQDQLFAFHARSPSTIPALITVRAEGVFMWARLVVRQVLDLDREGEGLGAIEAAIQSIPPELDELYRTLLRSMKSDSLTLIQWICFATRPLSVAELPWAMAVDPDGAHKSLDECQKSDKFIADDKIDTRIKVLSRGLAEIVPSSNAQVVQFIHQAGKIDVDSKDKWGQTPLWWAARNGREAIVKLLLATGKVDVESKSWGGQTPLWWAARNGHEAVVKLLLATGKVDVDSKDQSGRTPLSWAAANGHETVVKLLLATGKVNVDSKNQGGRTPLSWAAENGGEAVVKLLLTTGKVDVDSKDQSGRTPLWLAAANGREAVVKLLFDTGRVDVKSKDQSGRTPLSWAAENGREAVVKLLLDIGKVDVDSKNQGGRTPLSRAAANGHEAVVKLLLATGKVDVESKDQSGRTPLSWAAANGREAVVKLLLATGKVDVDSKDQSGRTPLSWAAENGREAVVKLLLDTGKVDVESKDQSGRTPLWWAARNGHAAVAKLLE